MLNPGTGEVRLTPGSRFNADTWPVRILRRVMAKIFDGDTDAITGAGWHLHHEGRCMRCGAPLTVPASVERGLGPECAGKVAA